MPDRIFGLQTMLESASLVPWMERVAKEGVCRIGSVLPEARAFLVAAIQRHLRRPVRVACCGHKEMERAAAALETWVSGENILLFPNPETHLTNGCQDFEVSAQRFQVLEKLLHFRDSSACFRMPILISSADAIAQPVISSSSLVQNRFVLKTGEELSLSDFVARLSSAGYLNVPCVDGRGQFAVRGGVVDFFSRQADWPLRVEWFRDEIESMREFSPLDQLSRQEVREACVTVSSFDAEPSETEVLGDYLGEGWVVAEWGECGDDSDGTPLFLDHDFLKTSSGDPILREHRMELLHRHVRDWAAQGYSVLVLCHNEGEEHRLKEIFAAGGVSPLPFFEQSALTRGFVYQEDKWVVLTDAEIFGRYQTVDFFRRTGRGAVAGRIAAFGDAPLAEWDEGDFVVHLQHGIGRYLGIQKLPIKDGQEQEVMVLEYDKDSRLYVPIEHAHLVGRYVGVGHRKPVLDTLGGSRWERAKISANQAVFDYAAQLLQVHAEREVLPGHACPPDTDWQREFEDGFLYRETTDQLKAIVETKRDMENPRPMDRLICGDVGFGKTEVAIRAAFKAVMSGKQVAFLCPTTVLAQQHARTLSERMAGYPVRVEMVSRFLSVSRQKLVLRDVAAGKVDIVVGTHRLLSRDTRFRDLGLLVVDEEQRFGVKHKEMMKNRFKQIDILTLSATPIPRTLYMALMGARDMSAIETPPPGRLPVETVVAPFDERLIRDAIAREKSRGGQVFYLHNRVESIERVAARIRALVPKVRVLVGHGQMEADDLEKIMMSFVAGEADVLVSTTIIESGLDIPNANTIIIDRADRFGLADLYQLRGRVGRSVHKAHAILLLPRHLMTTGDALKRTNAIKQYSSLGAGFKIAMRDLEIRGAGNLLGTRQSGHIVAIGFDLYCQLLRHAVEQMKKGKPLFRRDVPVQIDFVALNESEMTAEKAPAYLPPSFLKEPRLRIAAYRELAEAMTTESLDALAAQWRDKYGRLPKEVLHLLQFTRIKILCGIHGVQSLDALGDQLRIKKGNDFILIETKFPRLHERKPGQRLAEALRWVERLLGADGSVAV